MHGVRKETKEVRTVYTIIYITNNDKDVVLQNIQYYPTYCIIVYYSILSFLTNLVIINSLLHAYMSVT
jgi:hypothetical protein